VLSRHLLTHEYTHASLQRPYRFTHALMQHHALFKLTLSPTARHPEASLPAAACCHRLSGLVHLRRLSSSSSSSAAARSPPSSTATPQGLFAPWAGYDSEGSEEGLPACRICLDRVTPEELAAGKALRLGCR
jgi:hypothetical protein